MGVFTAADRALTVLVPPHAASHIVMLTRVTHVERGEFSAVNMRL